MGNQRTAERREQSDRRGSSDRRRQSDARYAMIEVCRSKLHLALVVLSAEGGDKVITRSIEWRKSATSLQTDQGENELTEAFRSLVAEERLAGAKVRIALSGELCVTRVVTGPTDHVRKEFTELEDRSLHYLTLGPGRKALAGMTQQLDARHQHALLAVANQRTLDLLMRIAEAVGVHIEAIEPSLIALGRCQAHLQAGCQEACLIVQLDESGAELGVCHQGRLLLDYRPGGQTNAENIADIVDQHRSRLERYLERYYARCDAKLQQVYLTGDPATIARAQNRFARLAQLRVEVLNPADLNCDWQHTGDAPGTDMSAVLGVALSLYPAAAEQQGPNLIESTLAQLRPPMRPVLIRSLAPLAAVVLVAITLFGLHLRETVAIAELRSELDRLSPVRGRAIELGLQLTAADTKLTQLKELERRLPKRDWQGLLARIRQSMPDDVWLERLTLADSRSASLTGASYTDTGIYDFVDYLKGVPDLADIALQGTGVGHSPTGPTTSFDLQLTLADSAGDNNQEVRHD